ncbi:MAG: PH domain-containing protein [Microlunatus sp.]
MTESADRTIVYRSTRLRVLVTVASLALVFLSGLFWVALPANLKAEFTLSQAMTLLGILVFFVGALFVIGSGVVRAEPDELYFRNGLSKHRYPWSQVSRVVLRPGDAWAQVLLVPVDRPVEEPADLEHRMLMGIQTGDGQYALDAIAELNRRAAAHS